MSSVSLSVIIPTWNGLHYLSACLEALMPQLPPDAEVVLVDNGSTDGTTTWVRIAYPSVRLLALNTNVGFAGGITAGLRVAKGDLLLLLNNDAFVEPGCIPALLAAAAEWPQIGAIGGVLTFAHHPELVASAGIRVRRDGVALDLWTGQHIHDLPTTQVEIMGPSGAAALYRRALLEDVGLPEPSFFAYLEDVDLSWRALLRGWHSVVVPQARVLHVYSATAIQGSPRKQWLLGRNRLRVMIRCLPESLLRYCLPYALCYDLMVMAYTLPTRNSAMIAGRFAALRELPELLTQRRAIQARRTASIASLARWLEPPTAPWTTLRDQRRLDALLRERPAEPNGTKRQTG